MLEIVNQAFDWLKDFSSSPWFYAIIFVIALLDSVLPIVPSETLVIIGGVSAGLGELWLPLVIVCGVTGAFIGDNLSYFIGREASDWVMRRQTRTEKGAQRMAKVVEQVYERGGLLLVTARFIPGGRTALTLSCGVTRQPRRWFVGWVTVATVIWGNYAALLGFIGGKSFEENHTLAFVIAFVTAFSITALIELIRWALKRARYRQTA
jgi:membrane protein DedA with SNARE-associated domain